MTFIYLRGPEAAVATCVGWRNSIKFIKFILNEHSSALDFACHCTTSERSTGSTPNRKQVVNSTDNHFIFCTSMMHLKWSLPLRLPNKNVWEDLFLKRQLYLASFPKVCIQSYRLHLPREITFHQLHSVSVAAHSPRVRHLPLTAGNWPILCLKLGRPRNKP